MTSRPATGFSKPPMPEAVADHTPADPIVCPTTPWYWRRMGWMFLLFAAFAAWFFYDYRWGYPKKAVIYQEYLRLKDRPKDWDALSQKNGWPSTPAEITPDKVHEQFQFVVVMSSAAAAVIITFLLNRGRVLRADGEAFVTPWGRRVPFDSVFRVDRRKWKHKGLATVFFRDPAGGTRSTRIDDLKFAGADRVLDRILRRFSGEIVDLEETSNGSESTGDQASESGSPEAEKN